MLVPMLATFFYSLLSLRVTIALTAGYSAGEGNLSVCLVLPGLCLRSDSLLEGEKPRLVRRYAGEKKASRGRMQPELARRLITSLSIDELRLYARVGAGEAALTALLSGAAQTLASAARTVLPGLGGASVSVEPDFAGSGVLAAGRCIFSARLGDIMFAALREAAGNRRKEGFGWTSILLKA